MMSETTYPGDTSTEDARTCVQQHKEATGPLPLNSGGPIQEGGWVSCPPLSLSLCLAAAFCPFCPAGHHSEGFKLGMRLSCSCSEVMSGFAS